MKRFFLAGVMQASRLDHLIESQDYRTLISEKLRQHVPNVEIIDPFDTDPDSVNYTEETARRTFLTNTRKTETVDVLIAYLPVASMGTAMEMWHAFEAGAYIISVSPMQYNWGIRFTSDEIYPDLDGLLEAIENGRWQTWQKKRDSEK